MDIDKLQKKLDQSKRLCRQFDDNLNLIELEKKYQEYIGKYSPAYLSGSPWYVGPSIIDHINNQKLDNNFLAFLFFMSHKINKS